ILPDGYKGKITYFYNYRQWMYKGAFDIEADDTGICYSRAEIADRGVYRYDDVIVGDFYCKNSKNYGFVLPCEATKYLDNVNHRCIGLVFYTDQHGNDVDQFEPSYNYSETGIGGDCCHGYVLALTDVQNDPDNMFEWELNNSYDPFEEGNNQGWLNVNRGSEDWGGYFNTLKILKTCEDNEWYKNQYPAAYAAYYYGNLVSGTVKIEGVNKNILFNNREEWEEMPSAAVQDETNSYAWQEPLEAPENTSGWYLPGNGMLIELWQYESLFKQRYEEIKLKLDDDPPYKEHIGWMRYHTSWRGDPYYWSSTESDYYPDRALSHEYSQQNYTYPSLKSKAFAVRAVLAY
ncbi:MAG: DUF1566 domain-containing protein, partial [Bacteroidaceae bacterium]|nr:DUF1566 domain-containing protein [Bacteroidaceae bacterium]